LRYSTPEQANERRIKMRNTTTVFSAALLASTLIIPAVGVYADDNPPGNHKQREELRHDQRDLEQLRDRRRDELREGDRREAREYQEKIRDKQKEIRQDRREIYGNDHDRRYDRDGRSGWRYGYGDRYGYRDRFDRYRD
jgi:uncharacterized protein HemX